MRPIEDYSDDELRRLLTKTVGQQGGKDRAAAIQAALAHRGVEADTRQSFFTGLNQTIGGSDDKEG